MTTFWQEIKNMSFKDGVSNGRLFWTSIVSTKTDIAECISKDQYLHFDIKVACTCQMARHFCSFARRSSAKIAQSAKIANIRDHRLVSWLNLRMYRTALPSNRKCTASYSLSERQPTFVHAVMSVGAMWRLWIRFISLRFINIQIFLKTSNSSISKKRTFFYPLPTIHTLPPHPATRGEGRHSQQYVSTWEKNECL